MNNKGSSIEKLTFHGEQGALLSARLEKPNGTPLAYALFAHCFTCSKETLAARHIASALVEEGFAVMRFDFTGLGNSEGDFAHTNFTSNVGDFIAASQFLADHYEPPGLIIGHSLGGAAVLAAANRIASAKAIVTVAAPSDPAHVSHLLGGHIEQIEETGEAEVMIGGRPFRIQSHFLEDIRRHQLEEEIGRLKRPLLVMHSPVDETVSIENAASIYQAAKHPKSFISLDRSNHLLTRSEDARWAGRMIAAWATRYIQPH